MKDTCKQAIFRKDTRRVRRAEDPLRAGDREERELEFFNRQNLKLAVGMGPAQVTECAQHSTNVGYVGITCRVTLFEKFVR